MSGDVARRSSKAAPVPVDPGNLQELQLDAIEHEGTAALRARGAAYVREYLRIEGAQTILLKNTATVVVAMRLAMDDPLGRTHEYRQEVAEMYRQANIPPDSMSTLQASVRYHVSSVLRRRLTPRELQSLVLLPSTAQERGKDRRATNAALLTASKLSASAASSVPKDVTKKTKEKADKHAPATERVPEQGSNLRATADHIRLATAARQLVEQLDTSVIDDHMTDGQRSRLDEELAAIQAAVAKLRRHSRKRRSDG